MFIHAYTCIILCYVDLWVELGFESVMQSGYWGRGSMDPEPGRCRRTDGKKWRCSRDVVAGQKYCERHVHRGRNRSRKPVEIPTPSTTYSVGGVACGGSSATALKTTVPFASQVLASGVHFDRPGPSIDLHQLNHRYHFRSLNNSKYEEKNLFIWFLSMKWHKPSSDLLNGRYNLFLHYKLICQLNDPTSELSSSLV